MTFYPADARLPETVAMGEFLLRMLRAADVELDYDAVVSSRALLLVHSGGDWPKEGFTVEENLADLQRHEQEHRERTSFTFTVMNPAETECLGCVYINPLESLLRRIGAGGQEIAALGGAAAWVTFWVRQSYLPTELDKRLLATLRTWFRDEWAFAWVLFGANRNQDRQRRLYEEAGMRRVYSLTVRSEPHHYYLYG